MNEVFHVSSSRHLKQGPHCSRLLLTFSSDRLDEIAVYSGAPCALFYTPVSIFTSQRKSVFLMAYN